MNFFFLIHKYRDWFVCSVPCFSLLKLYHIRINIDINIDLIVPFRILAWWLKNGKKSVPYFEVFRVLVMERNKNLKNLKKFYLYQCSKDPKICSVSVFQFKKHFRTERSVSVGSIPDFRFNPIFVEDLFLINNKFFFFNFGYD